MIILNRISSIIQNSKSIAIFPHVSADGDAIGSSLALALAIQKLNKNVTVYFEEQIPAVYSFLEKDKRGLIIIGNNTNNHNIDLAIALDIGSKHRLGCREELFDKATSTVNIDHHHTNTEFAYINYIDPKASATAEIVYELIKIMNVELDKDISECIYVAIATDTGGFKYSNTTATTHKIIANLMDTGINISKLSELIFDTIALPKLKLMSEMINTIELFANGKIAFATITDESIKKVGAKDEDTDGLSGILKNISGVEVAALLKLKESNEIRVSLRSKTIVDVSKIANLFSGGGHVRAAGFTAHKDIEKLKQILLDDIKDALV